MIIKEKLFSSNVFTIFGSNDSQCRKKYQIYNKFNMATFLLIAKNALLSKISLDDF